MSCNLPLYQNSFQQIYLIVYTKQNVSTLKKNDTVELNGVNIGNVVKLCGLNNNLYTIYVEFKQKKSELNNLHKHNLKVGAITISDYKAKVEAGAFCIKNLSSGNSTQQNYLSSYKNTISNIKL